MKKFLVLGTGSAQRDIIERCKEMGLYVIATSNVSGYSAEKLADEFHMIDITNIEATAKLAKEKNVDYVYSVGSDIAMETIAKVSKDLGLPCFIEQETARICNHKFLLRNTIASKGIEGSIPYQVLENVDDDIAVPYPIMMKPSDSQGQRGVRRANSFEEIKEHFAETISFSREKKVIVESYIEGDEISVNVFLEDGEMKFYLISDRQIWDEYPGGLIHEHLIPSKYEKDEAVTARIRKLVDETLKAIGLNNGPAYFQIKINKQGYPYLIEVTPRLDGCHMWRLIRYCTGVDLLQASIDMLMSRPYWQAEDFEVKKYSLEFLCDKPGEVFSKDHFQIPEHVYLRWYYEEGKTINRMNGYFEKCGYIIKKGTEE